MTPAWYPVPSSVNPAKRLNPLVFSSEDTLSMVTPEMVAACKELAVITAVIDVVMKDFILLRILLIMLYINDAIIV